MVEGVRGDDDKSILTSNKAVMEEEADGAGGFILVDSDEPLKDAFLINYDPDGSSRLLSNM